MEVVAGGTGSHPTETYLSIRLRKLPCIYIARLAVISARSVCTLLFLYAIHPMLSHTDALFCLFTRFALSLAYFDSPPSSSLSLVA